MKTTNANKQQNSTNSTGNDWDQAYAYSLGVQAYIYGFPWVYLSWLKWLWSTEGGKAYTEATGTSLPWAPVNSFFKSQELATPENATGGSPNCDTLYATAWLDVTDEPMILSVPEVDNRYYCIQMACIDADNFAYVGSYATGTKAANYLIGGPEWNGEVPDDVMDILPRSRTPEILLMGRTGVNDSTSQEDINEAIAIQEQYIITPLSNWVSGEPFIPTAEPEPDIPINPTEETEGTWEAMNRAMNINPPGVLPGVDQSQLLSLFATVGVGPNQLLSAQSDDTVKGLDLAAEEGLSLLREMGQVATTAALNYWSYPPRDMGQSGQNGDFITRAAIQALGGIISHYPDEAVYINTALDNNGENLNSTSNYEMYFKDETTFPSYDDNYNGFWSITMYESSDFNLVQDSTSYTINSYDPQYQSRDKNGGMTIYLQRDEPSGNGEDGVYWLQSPEDGDFYLILRIYVPGPDIWNTQTYVPPALVKQ
ncbi:DUF1254 domain-containing protein [uncultured Kordia sp.]|uniref:DUF1254 domain-containing protein n=1 Tax=uncultured Kordia sp. TaxID=507699 RepID=UPI00262A82AE|nr:DUF1254 domain-containing protein [uncultured Kordia sp.]